MNLSANNPNALIQAPSPVRVSGVEAASKADLPYCRIHRLHRTAFTLIEVLLAILVFAIVLAAINGVYFGALRLQNKTRAAMDELLPADHAAQIIKRDISNIVLPGFLAQSASGDLGSKTPVTAGLGMNNPVSLEIYTSGGSLSEDEPWGDIQKVDYSLQPSLDGERKDLVRSVTRNLLSTSVQTPIHQRLLEDVDQFKVTFFDGTNWVETWNTTGTLTTTNLPVPAAIRVELTQNDAENSTRIPINLLVPVMTTYPIETNL